MTSPLSLPTTTTYTISLHDALPILVDDGVAADAAEEIRRRYPSAKLTRAAAANYFANKNAGAAAASGEIIALVDADCVAAPDWLERLVSRFEPDMAAVAGYTRYAGRSLGALTFSVPDFGYVAGKNEASGFNLSN